VIPETALSFGHGKKKEIGTFAPFFFGVRTPWCPSLGLVTL
jgi:hypothetical protein